MKKKLFLFIIILCILLVGCTRTIETAPIGSTSDINEVAQYHRENGINTNLVNTWQNVTFDTVVISEITEGYSLVDNNESIQVNFSGIVKAQGKVTVINNATSTETQKIAIRITRNKDENRCTQVSSNTQRGPRNFNTIVITGTTRVEPGDKLNLQYQVDDTDLDISGDPVFDQPVSISLNLEKISG